MTTEMTTEMTFSTASLSTTSTTMPVFDTCSCCWVSLPDSNRIRRVFIQNLTNTVNGIINHCTRKCIPPLNIQNSDQLNPEGVPVSVRITITVLFFLCVVILTCNIIYRICSYYNREPTIQEPTIQEPVAQEPVAQQYVLYSF